MEKIAVFLDEKNNISSFLEGRYLSLFEKDINWEKVKSIKLNSNKLKGIEDIRNYYYKLILQIDECKILVLKKALGIPYSIFYQEDFSIWELEGKPEQYFESIIEKENDHIEEINRKVESENKLVKELKAGYHIIYLDEIQRMKPEITSKMVVRPFLEKKDFETLEIHCCHIPPWLDGESYLGLIKMRVDIISKEHIVLYISRK